MSLISRPIASMPDFTAFISSGKDCLEISSLSSGAVQAALEAFHGSGIELLDFVRQFLCERCVHCLYKLGKGISGNAPEFRVDLRILLCLCNSIGNLLQFQDCIPDFFLRSQRFLKGVLTVRVFSRPFSHAGTAPMLMEKTSGSFFAKQFFQETTHAVLLPYLNTRFSLDPVSCSVVPGDLAQASGPVNFLQYLDHGRRDKRFPRLIVQHAPAYLRTAQGLAFVHCR